MLTALKLYYLAVATGLFLYALYTPRCAIRALLLALAFNVFPLTLVHYINMDIARLGGMPLVYLPTTAVGLAIIARHGLRLPRPLLSFLIFIGIYLIYTFCNTVLLNGLSVNNLFYWLAWPMNFMMFLATASMVSRMDPGFLNRMLNGCVLLLTAASLVGLARFVSGFESDANFMPLMNRNGTVVLIALLFPLVFHVYDTQNKSRRWLLLCAGSIALCVALTFSRSGLVGLMAGVVLYYWRLSLMGMLKLGAALLVLVLFLNSGIAERSTERLFMTGRTVTAMLDGREVDRSVGDHNRVMLVNGAIANARAHFWFGTGLGMENYREGLRKASPFPINSKAHNFYLSYFAELGLVGFALLLAALQRIYAGLPPLRSRLRAFRVSFLVMALMMTMNEYILLPELWLFFGLLTGISLRSASTAQAKARSRPLPAPYFFGLRGSHD